MQETGKQVNITAKEHLCILMASFTWAPGKKERERDKASTRRKTVLSSRENGIKIASMGYL